MAFSFRAFAIFHHNSHTCDDLFPLCHYLFDCVFLVFFCCFIYFPCLFTSLCAYYFRFFSTLWDSSQNDFIFHDNFDFDEIDDDDTRFQKNKKKIIIINICCEWIANVHHNELVCISVRLVGNIQMIYTVGVCSKWSKESKADISHHS